MTCSSTVQYSSTLNMGTESVPAILEEFYTLMQLSAHEDLTEFCRHESFKTCKILESYSDDSEFHFWSNLYAD
jgi:hypothetical protein